MVKKIFRYLGLVLGALTCLPIFIATWNFFTKVNDKQVGDPVAFKLFESTADAGKLMGDNYQGFWFTLFQILIVVILVLAVVMIAVYVLNDIGVIKA